MARSRFTGLPGIRAPREERRSVSCITSAVKPPPSTVVAVRQTPFTATLSPSFKSDSTVSAAPTLLRHIVEKGSIAIDGISLTVATVAADRFSVSVIPHTAAVTVLGRKRPGDTVNLETDLIGKYVEKLLRPTADSAPRNSSISLEFLTENGF